MDRTSGSSTPAGASTRLMAQERRFGRRIIAVAGFICLAILFVLNWQNFHAFSIPIFLFCVVALFAVDRRMIPEMDSLKNREGDATRGAEAEETVGAILDRLPGVHSVSHDVPAACGNIDHVVIRKDGAVFLIETKSHRRNRISVQNGQLLLDGGPSEKNFISQTQQNVARLKEHFRVRYGVTPWINAAVVFTNAFVTPHSKAGNVDVINVRYLERWMRKARGQAEFARRLSEAQRKTLST